MTKTEILEFLELPDTVSEKDIRERLADKLTYFTRLRENAPSEFLRNLHTKNIEKIAAIREEYGWPDAAPVQKPSASQPSAESRGAMRPSAERTPIAWLIRHTEDRPAKSFPLFIGANYIGRETQPGRQMILIDDDPYLSRVHAVLLIEQRGKDHELYILDNASFNGGRASKNGTYINGHDDRITSKEMLMEGDTIQVGNTKLVVRLNTEPVNTIIHEVEESDYMKTVVIDIH